MKPTSDPTDRSMLRDTMTRTMPVAMIATPVAWTASVTMLVGWRNLPPLRMLNVSRISAEGDEHAEQPEVDLRLREQTAHRGPSGRLGLTRNRCRVRHVRHDGPLLVSGAKRPASPGDPGTQVGLLGQRSETATCRLPARSPASTPLHRSALVICFAVDRHLEVVRGERGRLQDERLDHGLARGREVLGGEPVRRRDGRVDEAVGDREGQVLRVRAELQRGGAGEPCPARWRSSRRRRTACPARRCSGWRGRRPGR